MTLENLESCAGLSTGRLDQTTACRSRIFDDMEERVFSNAGAHDASARSLPPELWIKIFQLASSVPGILDIDISYPFHPPVFGPRKHYYDLETLKQSLRTRHSLVLVCQAWYTMALEMLYQVVYLRRASPAIADTSSIENSIQCFRRTLIDFDDPPRGKGRRANPGRYTRHLLLESVTGPLCRELPAITFRLRNVSILTVVDGSLTDDFGWSLFAGDFARSLRRIYYQADPNKAFPERALVDILRVTPRLRTLIVDDHRPVLSIKLPRLSELAFLAGIQGNGESLQVDGSSSFPALRHMYIRQECWSDPRRANFFGSQGRLLTTLSLDLRRDHAHPITRDALAWSNMSPLWSLCSSLTHVHLIFAWNQLTTCAQFALPPTMTHLGIFIAFPARSMLPAFPIPSPQGFLDKISALRCHHGVLTTVRFTNADFVDWLREMVASESNLPSRLSLLRCTEFFRVEDDVGVALEVQ